MKLYRFSFLRPVFYFWTVEQPSLALHLPELVQPQQCVLDGARRTELLAALTAAPPKGVGVGEGGVLEL